MCSERRVNVFDAQVNYRLVVVDDEKNLWYQNKRAAAGSKISLFWYVVCVVYQLFVLDSRLARELQVNCK